MNLSSARRNTITEHGSQIVSGYSNIGCQKKKELLFCFVLFCFVFVVVVVVVSRVFKVPSGLCREFQRANCKGIQVWWVGWQKLL
jgi:hypothetical protein